MSAADVIDPGTSTTDYSQHFWGDKHNGYQVMYDNLKRGEDAISEVATFIKERLSAEEEYAKLVGKGTNKVSAFLSNGTCLENGWALTKGTFEIISDVQTMMVKNLQDLSREILKYKDEVAKVRKDAKQQEVIEAVNLMQTTTTCLQKAKETYQSRWVEFVKIRKDTSEKNQKEVTKAEAKLNKAREEYKSYVEKYEVVRVVYEEKMEAMCRFFQNHDRAHYANLHQFLMVYASHHQESAHSIQQLCGQLRESLQQQSVDDQLAHFVKEKGTGMDRPQAAVFEDIEAAENELLPIREDRPSLLQTSMSHPPSSAGNDLLGLDILDSWGGAAGTVQERKQSVTVQPSPTASQSSDSTAGPISTSVFGSSMGAGTKKLSMFMPKRKKTISQSSIGDEEGGNLSGGLFKFRQNRRSKKSTSDLTATNSINSERPFDGHSMDDARSTTSSSRSEEKDKHLNGSLHILDQPNGRPTDEEGFSIPTHHEAEKEDTNWSSCSSDEEDEIEMQQSRIRSISIKPAESAVAINASVDELRDAIGSITIGSLGRSNTFDKDPWSVAGSKPPLFSQSMTAGSLKPLRPAHTADGRFRTNFAESEFSKSNVPLNFSASCGPMAGMARARPRSNTPTHNSTFGLSVGTSTGTSGTLTKEGTNNSQEWGSSFGMNRSDSHNSLGGSSFNLSQSTANLMQATISEQRVPLAMALNEYSHVWFNGSEVTNRTIRTFGTVMISFANSSVPLLTALNSEIELLTFQLTNTEMIKTIVPNKQLLLPPSSSPTEGVVTFYSFDRLGLANWLLAQQKERPTAAFFNAEVLRYELKEEGPNREPPLLIKSYWKCEEDHTDLRVDYHLNSEGPIGNALLNLVFSAKVAGDVGQIISEPSANWSAETGTISWIVTELSKHGDSSGSLKARVKLNSGGPSPSAHTYAQFQSSDTTISGMGISLPPSDIFHLSMIKRKVQAGKYFCEPEIRK